MSTIGANVQSMPTARASRAATAWPSAIASGHQEAASAIGAGRIVRNPWITSKPKISGMPSRLPSIALRCSALCSAAFLISSTEPAAPRSMAASTLAGCRARSRASSDIAASAASSGSSPVPK